MKYIALTLTALAAIAQAIMITEPAKDDDWNLSGSNTIKWSTVSTDPSTVDIYVVDMTVNPSVQKLIASGVSLASGSYDLSGLSLPTGDAYQVNFVKPNEPEQIYAQSNQFQNSPSGSSETTVTSTGASSTETSTKTTSGASGSTTATGSSTTGTATGVTTASASKTLTSVVVSGSGTTASVASATSKGAAPTNHAGSASLAAIVFGGALAALI